jgi:type II secretory pathway component PulJ
MNRELKNLHKSGFTLAELLIYMVLFSMLLIMMTNIFGSVLDVRRESEAVSAVQEDGNYILARLMYDIRRSTATVPSNVGSQGNSVQLSINGTNYSYSLSSSDLYLTTSLGTFKLNGYLTSISNLSFTRIGNGTGQDTLKVSYTVTSRVLKTSVPEIKSYQTTIGLRCDGLTC